MASYYVESQDFGWNIANADRYDENGIRSAPSPRIALINTHGKWYEFDRTNMDAVIYWTSEALANERTDGHPIIPLSDIDLVYSSSSGPDSSINLQFFTQYMSQVHNQRWLKKLLPSLEITEHRMACTLGSGRLSRTYAWCKMHEMNLINNNLISFVSPVYRWSKDLGSEHAGMNDMMRYVRSNWDKVPTEPIRFEDDWRAFKHRMDWYDGMIAGAQAWAILPTKVYEKSSLVFAIETMLHNDEFFVTEKSIKALISGRPGIIVASRNNLNGLQDMGFRTWEGIVDESYQRHDNPKHRIDFALQSISQYLNEDVLGNTSKLKLIREIAEHNRNHLFKNDWKKNIREVVSSLKKKFGIE